MEDLEGLSGICLWEEDVRVTAQEASRSGVLAKKDKGETPSYPFRACYVQGGAGQTFCSKDTLELSLQSVKKLLPLYTQQEPGTAWVLHAQHVAANAAQQTLQQLLSCLALGPGSIKLRDHKEDSIQVQSTGKVPGPQ